MKDFDITVRFCIAHLIRDIKYLAGLHHRPCPQGHDPAGGRRRREVKW